MKTQIKAYIEYNQKKFLRIGDESKIAIGGIKKSALSKLGIESRSEHDFYNWVFVVEIKDLIKLGFSKGEVERISFNRKEQIKEVRGLGFKEAA